MPSPQKLLKSTSAAPPLPPTPPPRCLLRFERQRKELGWEIVPVLRNRQSLFGGIIESPFDT